MHITCSPNSLKAAIDLAAKVADHTRLDAPNYKALAFDAKKTDDGTVLSILAYSEDVALHLRLPVEGEAGERSFMANAPELKKYLARLTKKGHSAVFEFPDGGYKAWLSCGNLEYKFDVATAKNFPVIPEYPQVPIATLTVDDVADLHETVKRVRCFPIDTYPDVLFEWRTASIRLVSTGTICLSVADLACVVEGKPGSAAIPGKALALAGKILPKANVPFKLAFNGDWAWVSFDCNGDGRVDLALRLSDKSFPNYKRILPKSQKQRAIMDAGTLKEALEDMLPLASENKNKVHMVFNDTCVEVKTVNPEKGEALAVVDADVTGELVRPRQGPADTLALNARYLLNFLGIVPKGSRLRMEATSSIYPVDFCVEGDDSWRYIQMPIHM